MKDSDILKYLLKYQRKEIPTIGKLGELTKEDFDKIISDTKFDKDVETFKKLKNTCWIWKGHACDTVRKGHQHGCMMFNRKSVMVHRMMYHNFIEDVPEYECKPDAKQVNHKCSHVQNGKCINPWHMYLGTPKQNTQDAMKEGTKHECPKGEKNHNSKLSDKRIQKLLKMKGSGLSQYAIAKEFGINQSQVSRYFNSITRVPYIKEKRDGK